MPIQKRTPVFERPKKRVAEGPADEADRHGSSFTEFGDERFDEQGSVDDGADADGGEGVADGADGPVVAVAGVDDVDIQEGLLRDVAEEKDDGDGDHAGVSAEERDRAYGVGASPGERAAVVFGEGFGQDEETVEAVEEAEAAGNPEGQAGVNVAE